MNAFEGLPHITEVQPRSAADDALFAELAAVLDKYGARDRFGINLLHHHYPLHAGEVLIEETDETSRVQTLRPVKGRPANVIETSWRLGAQGQAIMNCVCPSDIRGQHSGQHISHGD
jgi:hypothetical protein